MVGEYGLASVDEVEAARGRARAGSDLGSLAVCDLAVESVVRRPGTQSRPSAHGRGGFTGGDPRHEHVLAVRDRAWQTCRRTRAHARHALLEPAASDAARRGSRRRAHRSNRRRAHRGDAARARQAPRLLQGRIRLRVEPAADGRPARGRLTLRARRGPSRDRGRDPHLRPRAPLAECRLLQAIALWGIETWQRTARNLLPEISAATEIGDLRRFVPADGDALAGAAARRDLGLARGLDRRKAVG